MKAEHKCDLCGGPGPTYRKKRKDRWGTLKWWACGRCINRNGGYR